MPIFDFRKLAIAEIYSRIDREDSDLTDKMGFFRAFNEIRKRYKVAQDQINLDLLELEPTLHLKGYEINKEAHEYLLQRIKKTKNPALVSIYLDNILTYSQVSGGSQIFSAHFNCFYDHAIRSWAQKMAQVAAEPLKWSLKWALHFKDEDKVKRALSNHVYFFKEFYAAEEYRVTINVLESLLQQISQSPFEIEGLKLWELLDYEDIYQTLVECIKFVLDKRAMLLPTMQEIMLMYWTTKGLSKEEALENWTVLVDEILESIRHQDACSK